MRNLNKNELKKVRGGVTLVEYLILVVLKIKAYLQSLHDDGDVDPRNTPGLD